MTNSVERIKRIKEQQNKRRFDREKSKHTSTFGKIAHEVNIIQKFTRQLVAVLLWMWWNLGNPFINMFTVPIMKKLFGWYIAIWNKFAFKQDKFGERKLSYKRGTVIVLCTAFVALTFINVMVFLWDTSWYLTTKRENEIVYLSFAQEINPEKNIYSVQGCELPPEGESIVCNEDNSLYYRVYSSPFHQIWSLLTHGRIFFPDQVVSSVGANWSECIVTSYGLRLKFFMYFGDVYPTLISAECQPISLNL